jgi:hypothetical protein
MDDSEYYLTFLDDDAGMPVIQNPTKKKREAVSKVLDIIFKCIYEHRELSNKERKIINNLAGSRRGISTGS